METTKISKYPHSLKKKKKDPISYLGQVIYIILKVSLSRIFK